MKVYQTFKYKISDKISTGIIGLTGWILGKNFDRK